jgi:hypothetical protein
MFQREVTSYIEAVLTARSEAEDRLHLRVEWLRDLGATWTQIGNALGTTPQAAQQRFGRRVRPTEGSTALLPPHVGVDDQGRLYQRDASGDADGAAPRGEDEGKSRGNNGDRRGEGRAEHDLH